MTIAPAIGRLFRRAVRQPVTWPDVGLLYCVGDVHGRLDLVESALAAIKADAGERQHQVVWLGDYVDRGPDSAGVLDRLAGIAPQSPHHVFLAGNHDCFLKYACGGVDEWMVVWLENGGIETLVSYGIELSNAERLLRPGSMSDARGAAVALTDQLRKHVPASHLGFLSGLATYFDTGAIGFAHASADGSVSLADQVPDILIGLTTDNAPSPRRPPRYRLLVHGHRIVSEPVISDGRIWIDTGAYATGRIALLKLNGGSACFAKIDANKNDREPDWQSL